MPALEYEYPLYKPLLEHKELVVWYQVIEYLLWNRSNGLTMLFHRAYDHLEQLTHINVRIYLPTKKLTLKDKQPNWSDVAELLDYGIAENVPEALHYVLLYT